MIYTVENDELLVSVDTLGAQLSSIYSKKTGIEYLWQGDERYWKGRAYNLFPYVGRLAGGKYVVEGKEYSMDRHGFARGMEFCLTEKTESEMAFCICANDKTKEIYPFDFVLEVRFAILNNSLSITHRVKNVGKNTMYFGLGGHPGFNIPFDGGCFEDYFVEFIEECVPTKIIANEKGLISGETQKLELEQEKRISLRHDLFDNDAIIMKDIPKGVFIKGKHTQRSIKVTFDGMSYLGLWHMPKTDAPFLCIEPWMTLPADDGEPEVLETKRHIGKLESFEEMTTSIAISINE